MRQLKSFLRQTSVIFAQMPLKTFSSAISLAVFQKKVSVCLTYMFPLFLPLMPDVSWTNSELLSNLALKSVKSKKQNINYILYSSLYNDGNTLHNNPFHVPVFLDEAIGSFSLIQASSSSTS